MSGVEVAGRPSATPNISGERGDTWPVSGGIVDPFVVLKSSESLADVPIPRDALRDDASLAAWPSSDMVGYLFRKDSARSDREEIARNVGRWVEHLKTWGITQAQVPIPATAPDAVFDELAEFDDSVFLSVRVDPHTGMRGVRRIRELARRYPAVRSVSLSPHMTYPMIAPNSKEYYPVYSACVEEQLAAFVNVGMPGPRVPGWAQDPIHLEEVLWFFPDLTVVMRHGGEPWVETCVKMLLRWPNLYYATTAFAPKHYPQEIIAALNSRLSDKVIWAGYWPIIGYDRLSAEVSDLPIKAEVIEKFLRDNARKAFRLPTPAGRGGLV